MFTIGTMMALFGLLLIIADRVMSYIAHRHMSVPATIVGYKQFPSDKLITSNDIFRGQKFRWSRIAGFTNPQTGQKLQMFSNPLSPNPPPIGSTIQIGFNPNKANPDKNFVWVQGEAGLRVYRVVGAIFVAGGIVLLHPVFEGVYSVFGAFAVGIVAILVGNKITWNKKE